MSEAKEISVTVDRNPFALSGTRQETGVAASSMAIATSRQAQEVQAAMVIAKKFPRNEAEAYSKIMQACQRKGLAEQAAYAYPKGGTTVTGPSIRLAEALAQNWGNLDFGIIELEQRDGESSVMAFCWDLETNTRQTKIFQVSHSLQKKGGEKKFLTDPRDIYEMVANQGARRLRACILGVIPGDVVDAAVEACGETLKSGSPVPLVDRVRKMATVFQEEFQVTVPMLEARLGHNLDVTSEQELVTLRKIYVALRDGMSKREQWFDVAKPDMSNGPEASKTETPPELAQEQPRNPGPASTPEKPAEVPNETLGADKERKKKEKTPPEAGTRAAMIQTLREQFARDGVAERDFVGHLVSIDRLPEGTTAIGTLGSDLLIGIINDYTTLLGAM